MIRRYTDHAANERTYLAWIRTAVALMGLGFVVERFDLFVQYLARDGGAGGAGDPAVKIGGMILIAFGVLVLAVSTFRYLRFKQLIASGEERDFDASNSDLVLVALVCLLALGMALYLFRDLLP
ncbi:MAG: DUF202 domain-containing protein [Myxococcales bacterium]|nr:DUF202 domain-containing protein [Myxococcales bacterium]